MGRMTLINYVDGMGTTAALSTPHSTRAGMRLSRTWPKRAYGSEPDYLGTVIVHDGEAALVNLEHHARALLRQRQAEERAARGVPTLGWSPPNPRAGEQ